MTNGETGQPEGPSTDESDAKRAYAEAVQEDLQFVKAWEEGRIPGFGAYLRVRQFRRAQAPGPA